MEHGTLEDVAALNLFWLQCVVQAALRDAAKAALLFNIDRATIDFLVALPVHKQKELASCGQCLLSSAFSLSDLRALEDSPEDKRVLLAVSMPRRITGSGQEP